MFICLSQLNRNIDNPERAIDGKYGNYILESDIFGSDAMLQHADTLIGLNNPVLFDGIENLLLDLEGKGIKWGIVTNKARYFAENIMKYHQLFDSCSVMMCGDDYGFKPKPSPELLIEACRLLDTNISDVIYIGDGHRDILSANSAKIKSVLACYGYLKKGDLIEEWQPNYLSLIHI